MAIERASAREHILTADFKPLTPDAREKFQREWNVIQAAQKQCADRPDIVFEGRPQVVRSVVQNGMFVQAWVFVPDVK
jgi:hypothetical protein